MASRKSGEETGNSRIHVPAQQDEEDIIEEAGGEVDEETGELVVDEEKIRKLGAIDAETVREARRIKAVAHKQKTGKKGVSFDTDDPLLKYDGLLKTWGPNSIYIRVKRLTGAQVVHIIRSCPRSGDELYTALMRVHGQHPEAEYHLQFQSIDGHQWRGTGRITLPDTQLQGQPMQSYPSHYGAPPQQAPAPTAQSLPQSQSPFALLQEALDTVQRLQGMQPQQSQRQAAAPQQQPSLDEALQLIESLRRMTQGQKMPSPQAQQPGPQLPITAPPPGHFWAWLPESQCVVAMPQTRASSTEPMHRPPYYPRGEGAPPYYQRQQTPPTREKTAAEQFREAMGVVHSARDMVQEMRSAFSDFDDSPATAHEPSDDNGPVMFEEVGDLKIGRDRETGEIRGWDTLIANTPDMFKWFGDLREKFQEEKRKQQKRLPPNYVEVGPGYKPPPGYVAVREDPPAREFPPPPEEVPPPLSEQPPSQWNIPE